MAVKISDLPAADPIAAADLFPLVQNDGGLETRKATGADLTAKFGYIGIPGNSQSGNYTTVLADAGCRIDHPSGAGAGDTITIAANSSVAYPLDTAISFCNMDSNPVSIAIDTDTLYLAGAGTTGTRMLAQFGIATALKLGTTTWLISGVGLT